jgi:hypothetical protein
MNQPKPKTLVDAVWQATQENDLSDACRIIQDIVGTDDGGVAGIYFSDFPDFPKIDDPTWSALSHADRRARLIGYLNLELSYLDIPKVIVSDDGAFKAFQASMQIMTGPQFGKLIRDQDWYNSPDSRVRVYDNSWCIEINDDETYCLTMENHSWLIPRDCSLEEAEMKLFEFSIDSPTPPAP